MCYICADDKFKELPWGALDDVVMGGVSESTFVMDFKGGENGGPTGIFRGLLLPNLLLACNSSSILMERCG